MTEPIAEISTAPAATSFDFRTSGWNSGEATSARNSKAVLSASAVHTATMASTIQHQSGLEKPNRNPEAQTRRDGVDPCVVLRLQHREYAYDGVLDAADPACKTIRSIHVSQSRPVVYMARCTMKGKRITAHDHVLNVVRV